VVVKAYFKVLS